MNLNFWGKLLIFLVVARIWLHPAVWGNKSQKRYGWSTFIGSIISLLLLLAAFGII